MRKHSDIEFGYDDQSTPTAFSFSPLGIAATTADGIDVFESSFKALDPFLPDDFGADQPGFATNPSAGLVINPGDGIFLTVLDASLESNFGVGFVNFYNPSSDALEAAGRISFEDNTSSTQNLVLDGDSIESGDTLQFVDLADGGGEIHDHIRWDLLDDATAPNGAYGLLVQLQSDFNPRDGETDLLSEPFWIVFNHGMSNADFENLALPKFGVGIPAQVASLRLNGGEAQRSAVETLTVIFDSEVTIAPGAFSVVQRSTATAETFEDVAISVTEQVVDSQTQATILFLSHTRNADNALVDGNYQLTVDASLVSNSGTPMLENLVFGDVAADRFFAFFGDSDANRTLNIFDLLSFRQSFGSSFGDGTYAFFMDFDANGFVNIFDLLQFRNRYLTTLPFTFGSSSRLASFTGSTTKIGKAVTAAPTKMVRVGR